LTPSELFAEIHFDKCTGDQECYWCGSPCERKYPHDQPPPVPFVRPSNRAKRPANSYICVGCRRYRMPLITAWNLREELKDKQCYMNHSWLMTSDQIRTIEERDHEKVYKFLLNPPRLFCLALLDKGQRIHNNIYLSVLNSNPEIRADTELYFTLNNTTHSYTLYELEKSLKDSELPKSPGIAALTRYLGDYSLPEEKKERGRPRRDGLEKVNRVVVASGNPTE